MRQSAISFCHIAWIAFIAFCGPLSADESNRKTREPSSGADEILRRFVSECVAISPGQKGFPTEFSLGTANPAKHELPARNVSIGHQFRISKYEVTQELFSLVTGRNPSRWKGPRNSAERMTFAEAVAFCRELTELLRQKKLLESDSEVRLPTYVEWEYCCRAGTSTRYGFGDSVGDGDSTEILDGYAWHTGNAAGNDPAVGVLKPNKWGLYDAHGYLWEFVAGTSPDGLVLPKGHCVIRGGAWTDKYPLLSCSTYLTIPVDARGDQIGIRCVIASVDTPKKAVEQ